MALDLSDEEIDALLKEAGVVPTLIQPAPAKEESLEKLLEEIMGTSQPLPPPSEIKLPPFLLEKEKPKRFFPLIPIWLSFAVLGAFFLGGVLGFYWGHTQRENPVATSIMALEERVNQLTNEVRQLSTTLMETPPPPPEEIIEPLELPDDLEKLMQEAIL